MELKYFVFTFINIFININNIIIIININKVIAEYQCAYKPLSKDELPARWKSQIKQMFSDELTKLETILEKKFEEIIATKQGSSKTVEWVDTTLGDAISLTDRAVLGGYEPDGKPLWIIKGSIYNTVTLGKLNINSKFAYYAYNTTEYHFIKDSDVTKVLCAPPERVRWVESRNGFVPPNAVIGGSRDYGDRIYIGRVKEGGSLIPGPIHPNDKALYITFGGKRIKHEIYEVLCLV